LLILVEYTCHVLPVNAGRRGGFVCWLMSVASGLGPCRGEARQFQCIADHRSAYAIDVCTFAAGRGSGY
jgi:hypothetical protein